MKTTYALWVSYEVEGEEQDCSWGSEDSFDTREQAVKVMDAFIDSLGINQTPWHEGDFVVTMSVERQGIRYEVVDERVIYDLRTRRQASAKARSVHDAYQKFIEEWRQGRANRDGHQERKVPRHLRELRGGQLPTETRRGIPSIRWRQHRREGNLPKGHFSGKYHVRVHG